MHSSFELPSTAAEHLEKYVDLQCLYSLARTSRHYHHLFQPYVANAKQARSLLDAAMNHNLQTLKSNYDQAANEKASSSTWKLLLAKTHGTERHNGKTFKSISVIQYAIYAGDYARFDHPNHDSFLLNYVLTLIPAKYLHHVFAQIQVTMALGTEKGCMLAPYLMLQNTIKNAKPILESLRQDNRLENRLKNCDIITDISFNQVATQQKLLPKFGLLWFCADKGWDDMDELTLPADREMKSRHSAQGLRALDTNLFGTKFLLYRTRTLRVNRTLETTVFSDPEMAANQSAGLKRFIDTQTNVLEAMMLNYMK